MILDRLPSGLRHPSRFVTSRPRPDHGHVYKPEPTVTFSRERPTSVNGSPSKSARHPEPWDASGVKPTSKYILAFDSPREEPPKAELVKRIRKQVADSDPIAQRRAQSDRPQIRQSDPKSKRRVAEVESKVKSTWEPTVNGISPATVREARRPSSSQVKKPPQAKTISEPTSPVQPSSSANTGRSSENGHTPKPVSQSTPKDRSESESFQAKPPPPLAVKQRRSITRRKIDLFSSTSCSRRIRRRKGFQAKSQRSKYTLCRSTTDFLFFSAASQNGDVHEKQPTSVPSEPKGNDRVSRVPLQRISVSSSVTFGKERSGGICRRGRRRE